MKDQILLELMERKTFTKDDFVDVFRRHKPLNLFDPIWKFIIEEEILKYKDSGAIVETTGESFTVSNLVINKYEKQAS